MTATNEKVKIYYINQTKKSVGSFESLFVTKEPMGNGDTKVGITFQRPKGNSRDKIEYYFNEEEWIEDVKIL